MTKQKITTKGKVLLVDDETIVRDSLSEWLNSAGYEVIPAEDGYKALEIIKNKDADVLVVDLKMPGLDGIEVLKQVKNIAPDLEVIIITAYGTVENAVEAMKLGAADYIMKPFDPGNLEAAIENVIKEAKREYREYIEKKEKIEEEKEIDRELLEKYLKEGEEHYNNKNYEEAIEKFREALKIDPSNLVAKQGVVKSERRKRFFEITKETAKVKEKKETKSSEKQCVWAKLGVISYRVCTNNFRCETCEFGQSMMDREEGYQDSGFSEIRKKLLSLPASERKCRYMLSNDVTYKLCPNLYRCGTCEYDQMVQDMKDQKAEELTRKLKKRAEKTI
jgi:YesN/AraC family two-component response regulator